MAENKSYAYQKFKKLLSKEKMTEYEFSKRSDGRISTAVLTQWSRGDYDLKLDKLKIIADVFGVSVTEFIE